MITRNGYSDKKRWCSDNEFFFQNSNATTKDSNLIRLIISRSEIDLATIAEAYAQKYKKILIEEIKKECSSGLYRDCLIDIIKGNMQKCISN